MWRVLESWIDRYFGDEEAVLLSILIVLVLVLMIYIGEILAPFFASVVFAFLLQGGVNRLVRVGMPYKLAVYLMFLCFTCSCCCRSFSGSPVTWWRRYPGW